VIALGQGETNQNTGTATQQTKQQQQPTNQTRPIPTPQNSQTMPVAQEQEAKPSVYKSACGETNNHDEADLCEQRRMAQAALDAVWWASFQTIIGIFGFVAVLFSLGFSGWAAWAAAQAARAAQASIGESRRASDLQLRAYVNVCEGGVTLHPQGLAFLVIFKNFGVTPARRASIWVDIDLARPNPILNLPEIPSGNASVTREIELSPNDPFRFTYSCPIRPDQLAAIRQDQCSICIWGRVDYQTVSGPGFLVFEMAMTGPEYAFVPDDHQTKGWGPLPRRQITG
jgi:hypothetical protein